MARIPAVVALKVIASPLKSIPLIPFGVICGNTEKESYSLKNHSNEMISPHLRLAGIYKTSKSDQGLDCTCPPADHH